MTKSNDDVGLHIDYVRQNRRLLRVGVLVAEAVTEDGLGVLPGFERQLVDVLSERKQDLVVEQKVDELVDQGRTDFGFCVPLTTNESFGTTWMWTSRQTSNSTRQAGLTWSSLQRDLHVA